MKMIEKIALDLCLDPEYVAAVARRSSFYYRDFFIEKKNGDQRRISQPSPELKTLQYWTIRNILCKLPISASAYAYQKGSSIKKHAQFHEKSKFIYHTDIRAFFPSITYEHLIPILKDNQAIFTNLDIDTDSIITIRDICFRNNKLCIGAVSSPIISNVVMYQFDLTMNDYCEKNQLKYSRYADDIYLSSNSFIDAKYTTFLSDSLTKYGFSINESKTHFSSAKQCRKVTGLVITTDNSTSIGSLKRNAIKKMVYDKLIHNKGDSESILGYLAFLKDVEPQTYNKIITKYSQYCKEDIIKAIKK